MTWTGGPWGGGCSIHDSALQFTSDVDEAITSAVDEAGPGSSLACC